MVQEIPARADVAADDHADRQTVVDHPLSPNLPKQRNDERLLHTPAQAARVLSVRESWLRRMAGRGDIPCTFLGKHLRFSDADLRSIVHRGSRPARRDT